MLVLWALSSVGRAPPLQGGGREFEPRWVHQPRRAAYISRINSVGRVPSLQVGSRRSESCIRDHWSAPTLNEARCLYGVTRKETSFPVREVLPCFEVRQAQRLSFSQSKWVVSKVWLPQTKSLASDAACAERPSANAIYINGNGLICGSVLWGEFGRERSGAAIRG